MRLTALALLCAAAPVLAQVEAPAQPETTTALAERTSVLARDFMVAAAHPLAAEAGRAVLERGGSAADAAVAVQVMLNLVEPQSSGLGGGGFLLYWNAALGTLTTFDGRERAPLAADETLLARRGRQPVEFWDAVIGGRSVGVPGTPLLLETVHARYGRLPWAELIQPAIERAEAGFEVSPRLAAAIADARDLDRFDAAGAYFFNDDGTPLAAGTTLTNPAFARTLRLFAAQGAAPFYTGAIARDIVAAVRTEANPGILTWRIWRPTVIERPPVCIAYRSWDVCGMGPPSSGALTVGQILGMLEGFDLAEMGQGTEGHASLPRGLAPRLRRPRPLHGRRDFVDMPGGLLDPDYLASRAALIDPEVSMGEAEAGDPPWEGRRSRRRTGRGRAPAPRISSSSIATATWSRRRRPSSRASAAG
jgi:gamma-glutamyltranspeptidase / glutathione hydrolase